MLFTISCLPLPHWGRRVVPGMTPCTPQVPVIDEKPQDLVVVADGYFLEQNHKGEQKSRPETCTLIVCKEW